MNRASVAAGPLIGTVSAPAGTGAARAGAAAPFPPRRRARPPWSRARAGRCPAAAPTSMPWALAIRAATGVAPPASAARRRNRRRRPAPCAVTSAAGRPGPGMGAAAPRCGDAAEDAAHGHRLVHLDEDLGDRAGHGRGHLGVHLVGGDLHQRVVHGHGVAHLLEPLEHRALGHRVAHLGEGHVHQLRGLRRPRSGSPLPDAAAAPFPAGAGAVSGAAPPFSSISPRGWPTCTVSSGSTRMRTRVPEAGDGTSASTLSVDTSTIGSSAATVSPTCLSHSSTVPSVTDSPIAGMVI